MTILDINPGRKPKPVVVEDVIAALVDARALIVGGMWCQRGATVIIDGQQCYCATAALARCSRSAAVFTAGLLALEAALPAGYAKVSDYNDAAPRDYVAALFTAAITVMTRTVAA